MLFHVYIQSMPQLVACTSTHCTEVCNQIHGFIYVKVVINQTGINTHTDTHTKLHFGPASNIFVARSGKQIDYSLNNIVGASNFSFRPQNRRISYFTGPIRPLRKKVDCGALNQRYFFVSSKMINCFSQMCHKQLLYTLMAFYTYLIMEKAFL